MGTIQKLRTIKEFHQTRNLPPPEHPLISVVDYADVQLQQEYFDCSWTLDFYLISLKKNIGGKVKYGQQTYDFDEGVMFFIAPGQVFRIEPTTGSPSDRSGWMLLIHPDFLWNTSLAKAIKHYEYFSYTIHEALFVSKKEEDTMMDIISNIRREYHTNIDKFSQGIIISQIETLLKYAERYYNRQFITRKRAGHQMLEQLELLFAAYFNDDIASTKGLPTVQYFAERLHLSPKYLSTMLKALTGQTAQQFIHDKLIDVAKEQLSITDLSISEIAYHLGFEHTQSFSKLFKSKTSLTPLEFRKSFNMN
ncbi:AraC family transcriptional regulator [Chitinophaga polysaccharea]|uniref:AraC family transcriptional regulator n=1 Tax=Chitinophaga polysaccharea TaxID=1293035 RepID=A0A561PPG1_9BACT|nr:response regulator transcription factor [Chitinophaga polysaccharea]TWF40004.1 AraC family transcriptional regulator [Chitinophaga polysaccharea]